MGGALARLWNKAGYAVSVAVRQGAAAKYPRRKHRSGREIARAAEIVVLAVPWAAAKEASASCGEVGGKVLVDCIESGAA